MKYPGFLGPSYQSSSYMADAEDLINLFIEKNETPNAPDPYCLLPTPGFEELVAVAEGPIRGILFCDVPERCFFVAGFRLYEWDGTTATARGTVASDDHPATLCWNGANGDQLFITSGDVGYCYELSSNILSTVLASGAAMGAFLDGYFLAIDAALGILQLSDLLDGQTWDGTQVAQRTAGADPWSWMTVIRREIWLGGNRTTEVWVNVGAFPFPFAPIPGAFFELGSAAAFSAIRDVSPLLWVAENAQGTRTIRMASGYDGARVSTSAIETALQSYDTVDDATSFGFQMQGHVFYAVTFPSADATWGFDSKEGAWFKWLYWNHATSTWEALRVGTHAYGFGMHLVGDRATGTLYRMGTDLYTDVDDEPIRRLRQPPRLSDGQKRISVSGIQVVMDVGVGVSGSSTTDPDVNPSAMLRTSRDGGRTWGSERWMEIGKRGQYGTRVYWTRCGTARNRVDQFTFSAAVPIKITGAEIELEVGTS